MPADRMKPIIEPFDPEKHDRGAFSCGVAQVDNFFKQTANKLAKADNSRVYVMVTADGAVIGFHAINAHAVLYQDLRKRYARTRPGHGSIPAAYISMIGVYLKFAGNGYGGDLLVDALVRVCRVSDELGISVVMLDVLDCGNPELVERRQRLYAKYGFVSLASNELRMFLAVSTVLYLFMSA